MGHRWRRYYFVDALYAIAVSRGGDEWLYLETGCVRSGGHALVSRCLLRAAWIVDPVDSFWPGRFYVAERPAFHYTIPCDVAAPWAYVHDSGTKE